MSNFVLVKTISTILLCLGASIAMAQTDTTKKRSDYFTLNGYVKDMQMAFFGDNLDNIINDNLIHNRLNFRLYPSKSVTAALEVRNRLFFGETVNAIPNYGSFVDVDEGYVDLSWPIVNEPSLVLLTQIDRAWVGFANDQWEIRAGRQRINWGVNLFWNSNDLFNAYSLVDFDYEERPGTDALRVQRYFKNMSSLDVAIKPGKNDSDWIGAMMYKFNKWQYDFQLLGGWWNQDIAIGAGWAGNMGTAGLKGEITYFHPQDNWQDTTGVLSVSISSDYVFKNGLFLTGGFLYSSAGYDTTFRIAQNLFMAPLTAKNLMPAKYSVLVNAGYPLSPLVNSSMVAVYNPGVNTLFLMPSVALSVSENWDVALFGQAFWMDTGVFKNIGNGVFIRLRGSF